MSRTNLDDVKALGKAIEWMDWMAQEGAENEGLNPESFKAIGKGLRGHDKKISAHIDKTTAGGEFSFSIDVIEVK